MVSQPVGGYNRECRHIRWEGNKTTHFDSFKILALSSISSEAAAFQENGLSDLFKIRFVRIIQV